MSLYIDRKFVSLVSTKLERFKQKSEFLWNFRCPICGDSHKNKMKTRGYFYRRKSDLFFQCHNCGTSLAMGNFLKTVDPSLYREYQLERYKNESTGNVAKPDFSLAKIKPTFSKSQINLPSIASLSEDHAAKQYLVNRKIPRDRLSDIYYADDFSAFVKDIHPDYDKTLYKEQRIVFPFYDEKKTLLGFQGRAIGDSKIKYITVKLNDDNKKVFGLDRVDFSKKVYVVEGIIDSMFLDNAVALMDASLQKVRAVLGNHDYILIPDRDIRNKEVMKNVAKMIELKYNVCLLPNNLSGKDINDLIMTGTTPAEIRSLIDSNTFSDLRAKLEFERWKKI
jgi:DNA primase catalytic core, N-terminal domain